MLVLMAVATTYMTTPVLRHLFRGTEIWESCRLSEFAAHGPKKSGSVKTGVEARMNRVP